MPTQRTCYEDEPKTNSLTSTTILVYNEIVAGNDTGTPFTNIGLMSSENELTIADVARAAGVSVSTVSRILNGKQDVAESTRQRVQQVIEDLGYTPHAQAQRLRAGKTRTLALVYPLPTGGKSLANQLELDFIMGAAETASRNGYFFSFITSDVSRQELLNLYRSSQVDGLVLMQIYLHDWRVELLRQHNLPFTMIGHCADNRGLSYIDVDFESMVEAAFDHLINHGHRRIGMLTFDHTLVEEGYGPAVHCEAGYERVLRRHEIERICREVTFAVSDVYTATLDVLDSTPDVSAIVALHDVSTVGVLRAAAERGRRIPDDLSVLALIPERLSDLTTPPLTGIDFPSFMMGQQASEMLLRLLNQPDSQPEQVLVPPRLFVRGSVRQFGL